VKPALPTPAATSLPAQPWLRLQRWVPWPLPAVLAWLAGWGLWAAALALDAPAGLAFVLGVGAGAALAALVSRSWWRGVLAVLGFPLSALALGAAGPLAAAWWLLPVALLLLAYPLRAWRDAPWFPTPADALQGLDAVVGAPRRVLDAGCGAGHGLAALQRLWPSAQVQGVEWSPLLARLAAWRCPRAQVRRGDMWQQPWDGIDLVYLFQRPESMARAWRKAQQEMAPGSWLVSLDFAVPAVVAQACLEGPGRRSLWVYAVPGSQSALNEPTARPISPARPPRRNRSRVAQERLVVEPSSCSSSSVGS
jgi:SAM-dependent methyltransferase